MTPLLQTELPNLYYRGKVRDTYDLGRELLMVATDRLSAFDAVLPTGIPDKGVVLNRLSAFWFEKTAHLVPNHLVEVVEDVQLLNAYAGAASCFVFPRYLAGRSMIVKKAQRLGIECVVRGYLAGSAWAEYQEGGTLAGLSLPRGLREGDKLPAPVFTPTTKADQGHDQPLALEEMKGLIGEGLAQEVVARSLEVYRFADDYARGQGVIIADTKMEFGLVDGQLTLIDELLTPDSSRFWDARGYRPGQPQPSFDKQPVRDWLVQSGWNKEPPAPTLPAPIVRETAQRYREAYRRLTGRSLGDLSG